MQRDRKFVTARGLTPEMTPETQDFGAANKAAGVGTTQKPPTEYTWHHLDDYDPATNTGTMQLIKRETHEATYPHNGGVRQYEQATGCTYK
jgi:hypothetical protein